MYTPTNLVKPLKSSLRILTFSLVLAQFPASHAQDERLPQEIHPAADGGARASEARGTAAFNRRNLHQLGGNGRSCADCHVASESFQLSPATVGARLDALLARRLDDPGADDPLFRPVDADDFRINGENASDYRRRGRARLTALC